MPSDLQVSNIKDLTGSNTGLSIASDGQVSITQNNPTLTLGSNATFPAGHIIGVHHSGFNDGQISFPDSGGTSGSITNTKSVNFNRKLSDSHFIVTVLANRYRAGTGGHLRSGYTIGVGSLSTTYVGQSLNKGEEDGQQWHNMSITYKDTTTGSANDSMYFGTIFKNTSEVAYVRGVAIMVMEVVS
tara:strand:+ start:189 stop:746 length:558 start_codon:yes stop_codon:yes gene_type:complete